MIKIIVHQFLEGGLYKIRFSNDFSVTSPSDLALFAKFGEPVINTGGTFVVGEGEAADEFVLDDKFIQVFNGLPYTREFNPTIEPFDGGNITTQIDAYRDAIIDNITAAYTTLRGNESADVYSQITNYEI